MDQGVTLGRRVGQDHTEVTPAVLQEFGMPGLLALGGTLMIMEVLVMPSLGNPKRLRAIPLAVAGFFVFYLLCSAW